MLRVIWELHQGQLGFRELQRRCGQMSSSVLSTRLAELTEAGLVEADADGHRLTELGRNLVDALTPLQAWAREWERFSRQRPSN